MNSIYFQTYSDKRGQRLPNTVKQKFTVHSLSFCFDSVSRGRVQYWQRLFFSKQRQTNWPAQVVTCKKLSISWNYLEKSRENAGVSIIQDLKRDELQNLLKFWKESRLNKGKKNMSDTTPTLNRRLRVKPSDENDAFRTPTMKRVRNRKIVIRMIIDFGDLK